MIVASWNVNGIRAVERKGNLDEFIQNVSPDILFFQEIKGTVDKFSKKLTKSESYHQYYNSAEKPGYAGTGIWIKKETFPVIQDSQIITAFPSDSFPEEGRMIQLDVNINGKAVSFCGLYFPNGGKSPEAFDGKLVFYNSFHNYINNLRTNGREVIWCGDVNCAHNEIDIARPKENKNSIGFLPVERDWVSQCIKNNWCDTFRSNYPETIVYSWWHVISKSRSRNVGWRIDYFFCDKSFLSNIKRVEYLTDQMGSDHCPMLIEL